MKSTPCCAECKHDPGQGKPCSRNENLNGCIGIKKRGKGCAFYNNGCNECSFYEPEADNA